MWANDRTLLSGLCSRSKPNPEVCTQAVSQPASQPEKQRETPNERRRQQYDTGRRGACGVESTTVRTLWVLSGNLMIERGQRPNPDASRCLFKRTHNGVKCTCHVESEARRDAIRSGPCVNSQWPSRVTGYVAWRPKMLGRHTWDCHRPPERSGRG